MITLSKNDLKSLQERRLREIVRLAYKKSSFYHELFKKSGVTPDDIKSLSDLRKLPFTSKEDFVKDYWGPIVDKKIAEWHITSGTSGIPTIVGFTHSDVRIQTEQEKRNLLTAGIHKGDIILNITPYGLFFAGTMIHEAAVQIGATVIPAGKLPSAEQHVRLIEIFKPTVMIGIPQYMLKLAKSYETITGKDPRKSSLRRAYALGEPFPKSVRQRLEREWNIEVRVGYGLTEAGSGAECEAGRGVHWPEDHTIVEVIDPNTGEDLDFGERGELVFTTLTRRGTVAIRFRSRDCSVVLGSDCGCGSVFVCVMPPKYRLDELVKIKGTLISPFAVEEALMGMPEIYHYMYVVLKDEVGVDKVLVFLELNFGDTDQIKSQVLSRLRAYTWISADQIFIVPKETIPRLGRKEKRFIDLRSETVFKDQVLNFIELYK
ncbi:MAG: AMP-binding protein [Thermoprotei archaeon]